MYVDVKSFHAAADETTPPFSLIGHAEFTALFEAGRVTHYLERQRGDLYQPGNIDMLIAEREEAMPVTAALTRHFQRVYPPKKAAAYLSHMAGSSADDLKIERALNDADALYQKVSQPYAWGDAPHLLIGTIDDMGDQNFCCVLWEPEIFAPILEAARSTVKPALQRTFG